MAALAGFLIALSVVVFVVVATVRMRRGRGLGSAAVGAYQELLIEDKKKAIEIVIEGRAAKRDLTKPADGDPDADSP